MGKRGVYTWKERFDSGKGISIVEDMDAILFAEREADCMGGAMKRKDNVLFLVLFVEGAIRTVNQRHKITRY